MVSNENISSIFFFQGITDPLPVYNDVDDWRRYLPPLHLHNGESTLFFYAFFSSFFIYKPIFFVPLALKLKKKTKCCSLCVTTTSCGCT